jgi:outer membrane murein-binding lipoprotein Lpp
LAELTTLYTAYQTAKAADVTAAAANQTADNVATLLTDNEVTQADVDKIIARFEALQGEVSKINAEVAKFETDKAAKA